METSALEVGNRRSLAVKRSTIVVVELGTLTGIDAAGYTLPGGTPLSTFLVASGVFLLLGNFLLVRKIEQVRAGVSQTTGPWRHIFGALAVVGIGWLVTLLFSKLMAR